MDFGEWNTLAVSTMMSQWTNRWLLDEPNGAGDMPAVQFFLLGENRWVSSERWPPEGSRQVSWYLDSDGAAGKNGGRLTLEKPSGSI
jgi:predicted acyl esterase